MKSHGGSVTCDSRNIGCGRMGILLMGRTDEPVPEHLASGAQASACLLSEGGGFPH